MLKLPASWPVLLLGLTGAAFLALDILDIHEDYHLAWSIPVVNTVLLTGIAVAIALVAARRYHTTGSRLVLGAGCALVLFGTATALKSWLDLDLMARIALRDYLVLLVAIIHFMSVLLECAGTGYTSTRRMGWILPAAGYAVMIGVAFLVNWLVHAGWLPELTSVPGSGGIPRMAVQGTAAAIAVITGLIALFAYRTRPGTWHVWYVLGLLLFGFGELYIALGGLTGKLAWTGRVMQYLSGFYLLVMLLRFRPASSVNGSTHVSRVMDEGRD